MKKERSPLRIQIFLSFECDKKKVQISEAFLVVETVQ
jgi:hypothetical protein